ncbi:hypothetical protein FPV67DRAFT_1749543 [Lyophyllum atratum]|nr:hypothetical protein FPV67DRAFT_1749543 [Lyophyllum atratum]
MNNQDISLAAVHSAGLELHRALAAVKAADNAETRSELRKVINKGLAIALPFDLLPEEQQAPFNATFLGKYMRPMLQQLNNQVELPLGSSMPGTVASTPSIVSGAPAHPLHPGASAAPAAARNVPVPVVATSARAAPTRTVAFAPAVSTHAAPPPSASPPLPPLPAVHVSRYRAGAPQKSNVEVVIPFHAKPHDKGKGKTRQVAASPPPKKVPSKKRRHVDSDEMEDISGAEAEEAEEAAAVEAPSKVKPGPRGLKPSTERNEPGCLSCQGLAIPCMKTIARSACYHCAASKRRCSVAIHSRRPGASLTAGPSDSSRKRQRVNKPSVSVNDGDAASDTETSENEMADQENNEIAADKEPAASDSAGSAPSGKARFGFDVNLNVKVDAQLEDLLLTLQRQVETLQEEFRAFKEQVTTSNN